MGLRLMKTDARRHHGLANYLVSYDHMAGKKDRYTVNVLNAGDPVTIGRELTLDDVRELIAEYERIVCALPWYTGGRNEVLKCVTIHSRKEG